MKGTSIHCSLVVAGALALLFGNANKALADATYTGKADFSLTPPPVVNNTFGYGGPIYSYNVPAPIVIGNASANSFAPVNEISNVGESAAAFGYASSGAAESISYNLGNLTGSGPPTPPAQPLVELFGYSLTYNLATTIDNPAEDYAENELIATATGGGTSTTLADILVSGNDSKSGTINGAFILTLPPDSVTPLKFTFSIDGEAETDVPPPIPFVPPPIHQPDPPPVPEPSGMVLPGLGGMIGYTARRILFKQQRTRVNQ